MNSNNDFDLPGRFELTYFHGSSEKCLRSEWDGSIWVLRFGILLNRREKTIGETKVPEVYSLVCGNRSISKTLTFPSEQMSTLKLSNLQEQEKPKPLALGGFLGRSAPK